MSKKTQRTGTLAIPLSAGFVVGLRSQTIFAAMARAAGQGRFARDAGPPVGWLRSHWIGRLTMASAAGERAVDKLPFTPSRLDPLPFAGRLGLGSLAGGIMGSETGRGWFVGTLLGALGAAVGSIAGYWARKRATEAFDLPDLPVALVEDVITVVLAVAVVDRASSDVRQGAELYSVG